MVLISLLVQMKIKWAEIQLMNKCPISRQNMEKTERTGSEPEPSGPALLQGQRVLMLRCSSSHRGRGGRSGSDPTVTGNSRTPDKNLQHPGTATRGSASLSWRNLMLKTNWKPGRHEVQCGPADGGAGESNRFNRTGFTWKHVSIETWSVIHQHLDQHVDVTQFQQQDERSVKIWINVFLSLWCHTIISHNPAGMWPGPNSRTRTNPHEKSSFMVLMVLAKSSIWGIGCHGDRH